jgi:DNA-binding SARP family transcriptional activator/TolB-like protein/Tfp pilus assembly protein PilF
MLYLRVLGGLTLENGGAAVAGPAAQRKRLALLAFLALSTDRGVSRDKLLAVFWPESDMERARGTLKQSLYALRHELGDIEIVLGTAELRLNRAVIQCDAQVFEKAVAMGELESAAAAYTGPFLDGVHVDEAPDVEHWVDSERDRLSALHRSVLQQLASGASASGDNAKAVAWWKRLARVDPLSASTALGLMNALVAAGDKPAAVRHAIAYEQLLRDELDISPDPAVTAFVMSVRTTSQRSAATVLAPRRASEDSTANQTAYHALEAPPTPRVWQMTAMAASILSVAAAGLLWWPRPNDSIDPLSIVILAPIDKSTDVTSSHFLQTIHGELINELSRIRSLRVRSGYSANQYRDSQKRIVEIGRELAVSTVVHGWARAARDSVHIRFELVQTLPDERVLAVVQDSADRRSIATLIPRIAGKIVANVLPGDLTAASVMRVAEESARKVDAEAYEAFSNGRYAWSRMKGDSIRKAIELYQFAIGRDSTFARAYVALAEAYGFLPYYAPVRPEDAFPAAKEAARKALMIDSTIGEAYGMLGWATLVYDLDWKNAEEYMRRALELSPRYGTGRMTYAWLLTATRRFDEAIQQDLIARIDDPLSLRIMAHLGIVYEFSRQSDRAIAQFHSTLARDSGFVRAWTDLGGTYLHRGEYHRALENLSKAIAGSSPGGGGAVDPRTYLAEALARVGKQDSARAILAKLLNERRNRYVPPLNIARIFVALGDVDSAFQWFDRAYEEHDPDLIILDVNPSYDAVREDPRFQALLRRVGFRR